MGLKSSLTHARVQRHKRAWVVTFVTSNRPPDKRSRRARTWLLVGALAVALAGALGVRQVKRAVEIDVHPVRVRMGSAERVATRASLPGARDVTLHTADGLALAGWYAPGTKDAAVVFTHGAWSNRSQLAPEAARLLARGYGVLVYDLRASGDSEGDLCTWGDRERRDVEAAVEFVASQPGVAHVGGVGFSIGAYALSEAAAKDRRIEAIVLLGATPSLREGAEYADRSNHGLLVEPTMLMYRMYGLDVDDINVVSPLRAMSPRPTLIVIGSEDPFIPRWMTDEVVAAAPESKAEYTVMGAAHGEYAKSGGEAYLQRVTGFFERYLAPGGPER
jgi:dienelactone hydrolase